MTAILSPARPLQTTRIDPIASSERFEPSSVTDLASVVQLTASRGLPNSISSIDLGTLRLHRQQFVQGIQLRSNNETCRPAIGVILERSAAVMQSGMPWSVHDIAIAEQGNLDLYTLGPSAFVWIEANGNVLQATSHRGSFTSGHKALVPARFEAMQSLREACSAAFRPRAMDAQLGRSLEIDARRIEEALSAVISHSEPRMVDVETVERYAFARQVEEFMWQHVDEPLNLVSIANATYCSVRKLLYCFSRVYGLGPIGYFKLQRLNAARAAFLADREGRTVLDIAADYGFWHLGHFGVAYKALFGETPSETRSGQRLTAHLREPARPTVQIAMASPLANADTVRESVPAY